MVFVFIYRRDLRVVDNTAWKACLQEAKAATPTQSVLPCFIFQEAQINPARNPYFSHNTVEFMIQSLHDLHSQQFPDAHQDASAKSGVHFFHSKKEGDVDVLTHLHKIFQKSEDPITAIYCNRDITPFAKKRDALVKAWCESHSVEFKTYADYNLLDDLAEQKPYQVYGAFWKRFGTSRSIRTPGTLAEIRKIPVLFATLKLPARAPWVRSTASLDRYYLAHGPANPQLAVQGGRGPALAILDRIRAKKEFLHYLSQREFPALEQGTTRLSAYLKYGCISIREAYHAIRSVYGKDHGLLKELFWREFYDQIAIHFPRVLQGESLRQKYDRIPWSTDRGAFHKWAEGRTGFPIVDAAMHQLNTTGYMHNRMRMVVASFLVKDLFLDWRWGEKYFATKLVDYYPTANNGGWTFASGSGADAQQYNRIFNPWLQSEKYDKEAVYIKRWLPQLKDVPAKHLHAWHQYHKHPNHPEYAKLKLKLNYPAPMVDHAKQAAETKQRYARVLY